MWERPSYSVPAFHAATKITKLVRRYLGRCRRHHMRRERQREAKWAQDQCRWERQRMERKRYITIQLQPCAQLSQVTTDWTIRENLRAAGAMHHRMRHRRGKKNEMPPREASSQEDIIVHDVPSRSLSLIRSSTRRQQTQPRQPSWHNDNDGKEQNEQPLQQDGNEDGAALLEAVYRCFAAAYHKVALSYDHPMCLSTTKEDVRATLGENRIDCIKRGSGHAMALLDMLHWHTRLLQAMAPRRTVKLSVRYTKVDLPYGWHELKNATGDVYYFHATSGAVTWDEPEYTYADECAAQRIQSAFRMLRGRRQFQKMLFSFSFVEHVHNLIKVGATIGWIGYGLEGMSLHVYLARAGLAKYIPALAKHFNRPNLCSTTIDAFWELFHGAASTASSSSSVTKKTPAIAVHDICVNDATWFALGIAWSKDEKAWIKTLPRPPIDQHHHTKTSYRRVYPLTPRMSVIPEKHGFLFLPNEKVMQHILLAHFKGQQGQVLGLCRSIKEIPFPISTKQLEMYINLYSGRPAQAAENLRSELEPSCHEATETEIYKLFRHGLSRCAILAANLKLNHLAEKLKSVLQITQSIVGVQCDVKLALSSIPLTTEQIAMVVPTSTYKYLYIERLHTKRIENEYACLILVLSSCTSIIYICGSMYNLIGS